MPLSFLRLELHVPYHRRYDLAFDSSFVTYRQVETPGKSRKRAEIRYYISYVYFTTSRPKQPRMELRLQMTYLVPLQITHSHLQILHILLVFQLVAQLVETGTLKNPTPDDRTNPYYPDLPILNSRKTFRRHFHGTTLFHATIQSFVQCLHATKYRELGEHCPRHLVGVLCDAYCLASRSVEATDQMQIGLSEIEKLIGHLFSAILSNLRRRGYRIRTHTNNTYDEPTNGQIYIRLLGCLSFETTPLEAEYNRMDRRNKYAYLHSEINTMEPFCTGQLRPRITSTNESLYCLSKRGPSLD